MQGVFISYSHHDAARIEADIALLRDRFRVAFDRQIEPGVDWRTHIATSVMEADVIVFYGSRASAQSRHCAAELGFALDLDKPILVVRLDGFILPPGLRMYLGSAQELRVDDRQGGDFGHTLVDAVALLASSVESRDGPEPDGLLTIALAVDDPSTNRILDAFIRLLGVKVAREITICEPGEARLRVSMDGHRITLQDMATGEVRHTSAPCERPVILLREFATLLTSLAPRLDLHPDRLSPLRADTDVTEALVAYIESSIALLKWNLDESRVLALHALELDPDFVQVKALLANILSTMGRHDEAIRMYERAFASIDRLSDVSQHTLRVWYLFEVGDFDRAAEEIEGFLEKHPDSTNFRQALALTQLYNRDAASALRTFDQHFDKQVSFFSGASRAMYRMYAGEFEAAKQQLLDIGLRGPAYRVMTTMAICLAVTGEVSEAEAIYRAMQIGPDEQRESGYLGLADLYAFSGRTAEACRVCEEAQDVADWPVLRAYHGIYAAMAGFEIDLSFPALDGDGDLPGEFVYVLGRGLLHQSKRDACITATQILKAKLDRVSRLYGTLLEAEMALVLDGSPGDAVDLLRPSLGDIDTWIGRFLLAQAYDVSGRRIDAIIEYQKCLARPGEAVSMMLDEVPTLHLLWMARSNAGAARGGLRSH